MPLTPASTARRVLVVGGGPAGLFAAERLAAAGLSVTVIERMPTLGRKFLMAGRGGLNLTHSEPKDRFITRYGSAKTWLTPALERFGPAELVGWAHGLGQETFIGSSGRVFPRSMKASPLLRAWARRLQDLSVEIKTGHRWTGFAPDGRPTSIGTDGRTAQHQADATLLALGGGSWPRLGSDGQWTKILGEAGIDLAPLQPSNMGVKISWSAHALARCEGQPLKRVALSFGGLIERGDLTLTRDGLEGSAVYALSASIRDALAHQPTVEIALDLLPDLTIESLAARLSRDRGKQSSSTFIAKTTKLSPAAIAVARDGHGAALSREASVLAARLKSVPLLVTATAGIGRAISSAGGVARSAVDENYMLRRLPGVFVAGEMLDWEAPTGGYLLQASFATAAAAADGIRRWLATSPFVR